MGAAAISAPRTTTAASPPRTPPRAIRDEASVGAETSDGSSSPASVVSMRLVAALARKEAEISPASRTDAADAPPAPPPQRFLDSALHRAYLSPSEADELLAELRATLAASSAARARAASARRCGDGVAPSPQPATAPPAATKPKPARYPLITDYYGAPRAKDGALPLDRWGSDYESWCRVAPATSALARARRRLVALAAADAQDPAGGAVASAEAALSSLAVNYYEGGSTCIPAHQDTVTSLVERSKIYCLTLGASRDFVLCDAGSAGARRVAEMGEVAATFRPAHGDVFVLGPETNDRYCHAIPLKDGAAAVVAADVGSLRVSVIFRSIDRSFVDRAAPSKAARYADGSERVFSCAAITVAPPPRGEVAAPAPPREEVVAHIADLIHDREARKLAKQRARQASRSEDAAEFYLGRGKYAGLQTAR